MQNFQWRNEKLDALRKREAAVRAAIAEEKVRQQKRDEKEVARLNLIVGEAMVRCSEGSPEFKAIVVRALEGAELGSSEKLFLVRKGWLSGR